jgi:hypothetical protein
MGSVVSYGSDQLTPQLLSSTQETVDKQLPEDLKLEIKAKTGNALLNNPTQDRKPRQQKSTGLAAMLRRVRDGAVGLP